MSAPPPGWCDGIERIHTETGGLMRLHLIAAADCAELGRVDKPRQEGGSPDAGGRDFVADLCHGGRLWFAG